MPNLVTQLTIQEYDATFGAAEGMVVCALNGLTVAESESLRSQLEQGGASLRIVRNRLARRVLAERGHDFPADSLLGSTAIAYGSTEATVTAAKVLTAPEFKKIGKIRLKAGLLEGNVLAADQTLELANIPDRDTLKAQMLGVLQGPARGIACVIQGPVAGLARVLQARIDQQQEGGAAE